jgi:hypothetical protein
MTVECASSPMLAPAKQRYCRRRHAVCSPSMFRFQRRRAVVALARQGTRNFCDPVING